MLSTLTKAFLLATALATGTTALVTAEFQRYFAAECSNPLGGASVAETYCVNIEDFPTLSYDAYVTGGECEDPATSPLITIYGGSSCESDPIASFTVGAEAQCIEADITIRSLTLACV
ncbi:hypothetical protein BDV12DRAFT_202066 [Aspergillus spectabilis]